MLGQEDLDTADNKNKQSQTNAVEDGYEKQSLEMTTRSLQVRYIIAGNPNTPKEVLAKMSNDALETVRRRIAENPHTPPDTLKKLAADPSIEVRLCVAENKSTPEDILADLANDPHVDVRFGVAENPHIPTPYLLNLTQDDNPYVAWRARKTLDIVSQI